MIGFRALYLTDNPTLGGTIRILQSWLLLGRDQQIVQGHVVIRPGSEFRRWLDTHHIPYTFNPLPEPSKTRPWDALWHAARLSAWARRRGIQVIHCNEHNIYPFGAFLRRLLPLPLVCHIRYRVEREYCAWAFGPGREPDALLWTSEQQRADCEQAIRGIVPEARQHLIPLGVDPAVFGHQVEARETMRHQWGIQPGEIVIGQATALRPRKRIEDFIDLVATLAQHDSRIVGVLAGDAPPGDEPYRDVVRQRIEASGLGRRFQWLGNLDDVEPFDQAIDVFVSTSVYETFGNSVCEAMACGRPIVAYRGGSVQEVVGDGGIVVDNEDVAGLVRAVRETVTQPGLRDSLGEKARRRVQNVYSPAATLKRLAGIYGALVAR
ncbi:MAG TPA: glycosyltransferase family 4 protein [Vicinamibacterales bacterium]|nr:glycosyltransferase family 4 protein [Vicinamibacterales bacterium]